MPRRSTFHHGDLRNALVRAAVKLLEKEEAGDLSLREVARAAGVTAGAPYHHFATRADLLVAVALEGFSTLGRLLEGIDASSGAPGERFERRVLAYLRFAREHPGHYRVMFHPALQSGRDAPAWDAAARAGFEGLVQAVVRVRPHLAKPRARALALSVWTLAHGTIDFMLDGAVQALLGERALGRTLEQTARHARVLVEHAEADAPPTLRAATEQPDPQAT